MRAQFSPLQRLTSCLIISLLTICAVAADKKKNAEPEAKVKAKTAPKSETKQSAKTSEKKAGSKNDKSDQSKAQLAKNKKDSSSDKKSLKTKADLVAELSSKKTQSKNQVAQKSEPRRADSKSKSNQKEEVAAKKEKADKKNTREEKAVKESAVAKSNTKTIEQKKEDKSKIKEASVSVEKKEKPIKSEKIEIAKSSAKPSKNVFDESFEDSGATIRELPRAGKFQLRPVVKITPKVQLNFGVTSALAAAAYEPPPPVTRVDIIEVYESESAETQVLEAIRRQEIARLSTNPIPNVSNKRIDLKKMDQDRISQIQEALFNRGYFVGAPNGNYDEATVQAMRKFQQDHRVDVTGYPTAQSLKLLGLVDYEPRFE